MFMSRRYLIAAIALAVMGLAASAVFANLGAGSKAPNFTLKTVDGNDFTLNNCFQQPGKVVVLDLWATWCPPCRAEIPYLIELDKKFKDSDVLIVGVSQDRNMSTVKDFVKDKGITYPVALDADKKVGSAYKLSSIPTTYIIDKTGTIRYVHSGFPRDAGEQKKMAAKMQSQIEGLLK
jgi:peroxiredoxin